MSKPLCKREYACNCSEEAARLHEALTGAKLNERECFAILCGRSSAQLTDIESSYERIYGKSLLETISSRTSGVNKKFMLCVVYDSCSADAYWLRYSMKGCGTRDTTLIHLMTSRTYKELRCANTAFYNIYGKDLAATIRSDTSGDYREFLIALLETNRPQTNELDAFMLYTDAAIVTSKLPGVSFGSGYIIRLLASSSDAHVMELERLALKATERSLIEIFGERTSGSFAKAVRICLEYRLRKFDTFAAYLKNAIECDDEVAVAIALTTRSRIDLGSILECYDRLSWNGLIRDIEQRSNSIFWTAVKVFVSESQ